MVEERLEAVDGRALIRPLRQRFGLRPRRPLGWRHHRAALGLAGGRVVIVEEHRGPRAPQVPLDVVGQQAEEHVRPDPVGLAVMNGARLEVDGLEAPKRALDGGEAFVAAHGLGRRESIRREARPEDIDAINGGLAGDGRLVARGADARVGDLEREVLADLATPEYLADPERDAGLAAERPPGPLSGGGDLRKVAFGRL